MKLYLILTFLFFVIYKNKTCVDCVVKKQDVYLDDEFKSFTFFFASSPSANFLSRIVHSNEAKFTQIKNKTDIWNKTIDKAYSINQISNNIMRVYISLLLLFLFPYFAYIGIFGHSRNKANLTLSSLWAYFALLVSFYLFNGILNIGFVTSLPLVVAVLVFILGSSDCEINTLYKYTRYIFCFISSKLIYDVVTYISTDGANIFDYGLSGHIYMNLLKGKYYIVLKLIHLIILSLISLMIIKICPKIFSNNHLKSPISIRFDKYIVSFLCSLPIATAISQVFYLLSKTINPIDPSIFFMIPSSINFSSTSTIFSLSTWIAMSYLMTFLRNKVEGDYNSILNKIPNNLPDFI
ncbi:sexual stage-specific protein G37, putative [Plasmodium yoelii]|uniref:Sexual stage-specific protein G37, putative n=1 Tax=Plasmodium yoelii TaxID=5861 RepID=A0A078KD05_PLAYE|nr:sexual stage-specific protein G37, putative [Plasmodium yoelii]CDU16911.1 conserved Plasmodium protein, unknown function [Plasmodium yoelii]VTZ75196.1 sexual stage-specific protein G37, putative [Plasmodium yoelii]|eukprot:XP_022813133.1 sexual stage-specific protein G37, putative [Plasmodium yoelii]